MTEAWYTQLLVVDEETSETVGFFYNVNIYDDLYRELRTLTRQDPPYDPGASLFALLPPDRKLVPPQNRERVQELLTQLREKGYK